MVPEGVRNDIDRGGVAIKLQNRYPTEVVNDEPLLLSVLCRVAQPAHGLKVLPVQGHSRVAYVLRRDVYFVVNNDSRRVFPFTEAAFAQTSAAFKVSGTAVLPRL